MRQVKSSLITQTVEELYLQANFRLRDDVVAALQEASRQEQSQLGRDILKVLIKNATIAREQEIPLCQDTGSANVFLEIGQDVSVTGDALERAVNEGIRNAYQRGFLRTSIVSDPLFTRVNTSDNTPAFLHCEMTPGDRVTVKVMPKGAGCDNASRLKMLNPSDGLAGVKKFVLSTIERSGGRACPPLVVGIGVGGNFEMAPLLAKKALFRRLGDSHPVKRVAQFERELVKAINSLGIGPMGVGGLMTVLGVFVSDMACHMASLPVAVNVSCHSLRSAERTL